MADSEDRRLLVRPDVYRVGCGGNGINRQGHQDRYQRHGEPTAFKNRAGQPHHIKKSIHPTLLWRPAATKTAAVF